MYKEKRQLSAEDTQALFAQGHHGIISMNGDDGYPYAVPVNYVFIDGKIYIHSAKLSLIHISGGQHYKAEHYSPSDRCG